MSLRVIRPENDERLGWLAATFESVSDLVFISDLQDRFIYANPAALKKLGYARDEIIGKTASLIMSPNNPKGLREELIKATLQNPNGWEGEVLNVRKDGTEYCAHLKTALVRNKRQEPIGMTGISRDITELVAKEKMAAIGMLSSTLAHEIGNPLASISSLVQLLERRIQDEKILENLKLMRIHIQRISQLIYSINSSSLLGVMEGQEKYEKRKKSEDTHRR